MKSNLRLALVLLALGFIFTPLLKGEAATVTVTVRDASKGEETQFSTPEITGYSALLPIVVRSQDLLLKANWGVTDEKGTKVIHVSMQNPGVILSGVANEGSLTPSGALVILSAEYPYVVGKRILVYKSYLYSLWIQLDEDKKE